MSTVLPVIQTRTTGVPVESAAPAGTGDAPGAVAPPIADTPFNQVYGGNALVIWSSTCGQI